MIEEEEEKKRFKMAQKTAKLWKDGFISGHEYVSMMESVMTPQNIISIVEMTKELHLDHFLANAEVSIDPYYLLEDKFSINTGGGPIKPDLPKSQKLNVKLAYLTLLKRYKKA